MLNDVAKSLATYVASHVVNYVVNGAAEAKGDGLGNQIRVLFFFCLRVGCWCRPRVVAVKKREEWRLRDEVFL